MHCRKQERGGRGEGGKEGRREGGKEGRREGGKEGRREGGKERTGTLANARECMRKRECVCMRAS